MFCVIFLQVPESVGPSLPSSGRLHAHMGIGSHNIIGSIQVGPLEPTDTPHCPDMQV